MAKDSEPIAESITARLRADDLEVRLGADDPWPSLAAFTENASAFFKGRQHEIDELYDRVTGSKLTVLFGVSGLGKTSLLQAGVFPRLREHGFLPIRIRLDYESKLREDLVDQVRAELGSALNGDRYFGQRGPTSTESLWSFFHQPELAIRDRKNGDQKVTPVLVFDQFEEIFTHAKGDPSQEWARRAFLEEIARLVDNQIPVEVRREVESNPAARRRYDFDAEGCRIIFTLREDYLPHLEDFGWQIPAITENRFRLLPMNQEQAFEAVSEPGAKIVEPAIARKIVEFAAGESDGGIDGGGNARHSRDAVVSPALLSLICSELNQERKAEQERTGTPQKITAAQVEKSAPGILARFYDRSFEGLPHAGETEKVVEDHLLAADNQRERIALATVVAALQKEANCTQGTARHAFEHLRDKRLVQFDTREGRTTIELTHDVLTKVVTDRRAARVEVEAKKELARAKQQARNRGILVAKFAAITVLAVVAMIWAIFSERKASSREIEAIANRDLATTNGNLAIANLALAHANLNRATNAETQLLKANEDLKARAQILAMTLTNLAAATNSLARTNLSLQATTADLQLATNLLAQKVQETESARSNAILSEAQYRNTLFDSYLLQAQAGIESEDYERAKAALDKSRDAKLTVGIPATRISIRNSLAATVELLGGEAIQTNKEAQTPLRGIAVSQAGDWLFVAGEKGKLLRFDLKKNGPAEPFVGHHESVESVVLDLSASKLISADTDRSILRWSASDQKISNQWRSPGGIDALAASANGEILVIGGRELPLQWTSLREQGSFTALPESEKSITAIAFSPDDRFLAAVGTEGALQLWRIERADDKGMRRAKGPISFPKYQPGLLAIAFNPAGTEIATGSAEGSIQIWDRDAEKLKYVLHGHRNKVAALAYSPDGKSLVSAAWDKTLRVWDVQSRTTTKVLQGHECAVTGVAIVAQRVFSCSLDGTWRVWSLGENRLQQAARILVPADRPTSCGLAPNAISVVIGSERGDLGRWSLTKKTNLWAVANAHGINPIVRTMFSPDGKKIASVGLDGTFKLWDAETGSNLTQFNLDLAEVNDVAFSSDGKKVAIAGAGGRTRLNNGPRLVQTHEQGQIGILDFTIGTWRFAPAPGGELLSAAFDQKGTDRLLSVSTDGSASAWEFGGNRFVPTEIVSLKGDAATSIGSGASARFIAVGYRNGSIQIVNNAPPYRQIARFVGHEDTLIRLVISPDSAQMISLSADRTVRIWDVEAQHQLLALRLPIAEEDRATLWDFSYLAKDSAQGETWMAAPLVRGEVAVYRLGCIF